MFQVPQDSKLNGSPEDYQNWWSSLPCDSQVLLQTFHPAGLQNRWEYWSYRPGKLAGRNKNLFIGIDFSQLPVNSKGEVNNWDDLTENTIPVFPQRVVPYDKLIASSEFFQDPVYEPLFCGYRAVVICPSDSNERVIKEILDTCGRSCWREVRGGILWTVFCQDPDKLEDLLSSQDACFCFADEL